MRIVPVIDLRGGRAVTGRSGDRSRYAPVMSRIRGGAAEDLSEPRLLARALAETLAPGWIYIADLDRIEGTGENDAVVVDLLDDHPALVLLWDGGLSGAADLSGATGLPYHPRLVPILASETLAAAEGIGGAHQVGESGSAAAHRVGRHWLGLDLEEVGLRARVPAVASLGEEMLLRRAADAGIAGAVVVLLRRVGTGTGMPRQRLARLRAAAPTLDLVAGGGVGALDDLLFLRAAGYQGALLATALHDGRLRPADLAGSGFAGADPA